MNVENTVLEYITDQHILNKDKKYLVALSGGADSVALLLILQRLGYSIEAAHCNFKLRGDESDRDENFCKNLCEERNISLHIIHFDTTTYANFHKVSIEMAARELRYSYFENLRRDLDMDGICVAHHNNDNVETLFINLIRGTGLQGLTGISPVNGFILRPLLCLDRKKILDYLSAKKQDYVTDSTNLCNDVVRNRIRLDLLPLLQTINPSIINNVSRTMRHLNEIRKIVNQAVGEVEKSITKTSMILGIERLSISKNGLKETSSPEYTLFHIITRYGFTPAQIENIASSMDTETGKRWFSPTHTLLMDRTALMVEPTMQEAQLSRQMRIPEAGCYSFDEHQKFVFSQGNIDNGFLISKKADMIHFDSSKVDFPFSIRHLKPGDRFIPFGMKTSKLLSDYLTDRKMSWFDRQRQLVVVNSKDEIVWVVNERMDNNAKITPKSKHYICIEYLTKSNLD